MGTVNEHAHLNLSMRWWMNCGEISRLMRWLESEDGLDVADCIAIVEKPWHWDAEYQEMCKAQARPGERARDLEVM